MDSERIIDLFFENIKNLFFPENWLQIDLKFSKFDIFAMLLIDKREEITMTELSEYINTPMSTANGIIERLVKKEYVQRDRSDSDRRIVVLRLTEEGTKFVSSLKELLSSYIKIALDALSEEEIQTVISIVLKVIQSFQSKMTMEQTHDKQIKKIAIE